MFACAQVGFIAVVAPGPIVAIPQHREYKNRPPALRDVFYGNTHQDVCGIAFRVLYQDIKVTVVKNSGVLQLVFTLVFRAGCITLSQLLVRESLCGILVEHAHVGVGGRRIPVKKELFHIFAMIPFRVREAKKPFFQHRVFAVPERRCQTKPLFWAADTGDTVFAPPIGVRHGTLIRSGVPCVAGVAVVFPHRTPLTVAHVGSPALPVRILQSVFFCSHALLSAAKLSLFPQRLLRSHG